MNDISEALPPQSLRVKPTLGRLVPIAIRDVWPREDRDFTPWLAEPENLSLLAETLRLRDLRVEGTEVPVGDFSIDILARDAEDRAVVIENQFGPTDHRHLGQILTYVAGQEGQATIVWIAETIREEHRAAIDWLNSTTIEGYDFFAVKIEALRIDTSPPAPLFNVLAKPNSWSRGVARTARAAAVASPPSERQQTYNAYWTAFGTFLEDNNAPFKMNKAPIGYWCSFGLGRTGFRLAQTLNLNQRRLGAMIEISHPAAKTAFDLLMADRAAIEAEFGAPLEWERLDDNKGSRIAVYRTDLDPRDENQRPQQFGWFLDQMQRFSKVFVPRIRALRLDAAGDELDSTEASVSNVAGQSA